jgi:general secretion pathway protein G
MNRNTFARQRAGFTLVELVVVILIVGILAAVAAPRMFDTANNARDNGTRQSLVIIRDAIELYRADNGSYPPAASLATALRPYIKSAFPSVQCGPNKNATVVASSQNPITTPESGTAGWVYNATTGDFAINATSYIAW